MIELYQKPMLPMCEKISGVMRVFYHHADCEYSTEQKEKPVGVIPRTGCCQWSTCLDDEQNLIQKLIVIFIFSEQGLPEPLN